VRSRFFDPDVDSARHPNVTTTAALQSYDGLDSRDWILEVTAPETVLRLALRLTGTRLPRLVSDERPRPDARAESVYRKAVAHEMLQARESVRGRALDPFDARWQFATAVESALQGATLAYEDRRRLLGMATRLGIREFDAHLIVALVQDRARRGESIEGAAPTIALLPVQRATKLQPDDAKRVSLRIDRSQDLSAHTEASPAVDPETPTSSAIPWVAAMVAAIAIDAALIAWLMFG
jgi:hypothetical protein